MRLLAPSVKMIYPVSHAVTTSFLNYGFDPSKFTVIHNGLNIIQCEPNNTTENATHIRIGWIGQFAPWKGIEEFINLCKAMINQKENIKGNVKFIIAGSALFGNDDYEEQIKGMVEGVYKKYFTFLGHISDVDSFYNGLDIYFHTSIAPDPFPTTILEAGSRGLLVFASDLGGAQEIVTDNVTGYLINMEDHKTTLSKTIDVLNNFESQRVKGTKLKHLINKDLNSRRYRNNFEAELLQVINGYSASALDYD